MMWEIITFLVGVAYAIWIGRLVRFGVRTATRIAEANEATVENLAILIDALPPERCSHPALRIAPPVLPLVSRPSGVLRLAIVLAGLIGLLVLGSYAHSEPLRSTVQRDAPTVRFYTPDGRSAGSASTYGNTTRFYDARGNSIGSATRADGRH